MPAALTPTATPPVASPATAPVAPPTSGGRDDAGGFAAALAAAGADRVLPPAARASVGLSEMLAVRAQGSVLPASPATLGGASGVDGVRPLPGLPRTGGDGAAVLAAGERYLGVPYVWGGTDPARGFDCSGFVQRVYADLGVDLPRVSVDQARAGTAVPSLDQARPGDLVFWHGSGSRPNHIGIYAGDGRMLVAPRTGDVVRYQELTRPPDVIRRVS